MRSEPKQKWLSFSKGERPNSREQKLAADLATKKKLESVAHIINEWILKGEGRLFEEYLSSYTQLSCRVRKNGLRIFIDTIYPARKGAENARDCVLDIILLPSDSREPDRISFESKEIADDSEFFEPLQEALGIFLRKNNIILKTVNSKRKDTKRLDLHRLSTAKSKVEKSEYAGKLVYATVKEVFALAEKKHDWEVAVRADPNKSNRYHIFTRKPLNANKNKGETFSESYWFESYLDILREKLIPYGIEIVDRAPRI